MGRFEFPLKLDDGYPCRGTDAKGKDIYFDDLLFEGEIVASVTHGDDHFPPYGRVVAKDDGLWIEAAPDYKTEAERDIDTALGEGRR